MDQLNTNNFLRKSSSGEELNTVLTSGQSSVVVTTGVTQENEPCPAGVQDSPSMTSVSESSEGSLIEKRVSAEIKGLEQKEDDETPKRISPIDIEKANRIADAIREADYEAYSSSSDKYIDFEDDFFCDPPPMSVSERETKIEQDKKEQEKRIKVFIETEKEIHTRAISILHKDSEIYKNALRELKTLGKQSFPSLAILNLTKDINAQPRAIELLTVIINCYYYEDSREFLDRDVSLEASFLIFNYYLDAYNSRATEIENPEQMDRNLHGLLQLCHTYIPDHWSVDIYDPESPICHIHDMINNQLLTLNIWYLENPMIFKTLPATERFFACGLLNLFTLGMTFLKCTTYGALNIFPDLVYMLKSKGFIGIKRPCRKPEGSFQHIWNHPRIPLQIRITQNGKLTVGILKNIPLDKDQQLIKTLIGVDEDNEILKISHPDIAGCSIPARHKTEWAQKLWVNDTNEDLRNELMAEAHRKLELGDMKFDQVSYFLNPDEKPKPVEETHPTPSKNKAKKKNVRQKK